MATVMSKSENPKLMAVYLTRCNHFACDFSFQLCRGHIGKGRSVSIAQVLVILDIIPSQL